MINVNESNQLPESLQVNLSEREWVETFVPESHKIVKGLHRELTHKRTKLVAKIEKAFAAIDAESIDEEYRYFWKAAFHAKYKLDEQLRDVDVKLARQRRYLTIINNKPLPEGAINAELIQAAKDVPIESLFSQQFKQTGNKLRGLCPFVPEKTPSFFVYMDTNRCWCFGCQQGYGVLDTYMKLHDCNFNEAVLALTGGMV